MWRNTEAYLEPGQTSMVKPFLEKKGLIIDDFFDWVLNTSLKYLFKVNDKITRITLMTVIFTYL